MQQVVKARESLGDEDILLMLLENQGKWAEENRRGGGEAKVERREMEQSQPARRCDSGRATEVGRPVQRR